MAIYNFLPLVGKKISVAIDNNKPATRDIKESYGGILKQVFDDYIVLNYSNPNRTDLDQIVINRGYIVSIWVYNT